MPAHAGCCCQSGECYCGTLCTACNSECVAVPTTACIEALEYESHVGGLPGVGAGAVISVGGAYYFFAGTKGPCSTGPADPDDIEWDISFLADSCPDAGDVVSIALPFFGGFDFSTVWTVRIAAEGLNDYATAGCTSAPHLHNLAVTYANTSSDPVLRYYGSLSDTTATPADGHACVGNSDFEDDSNSCPLGSLPAWADSVAVFAEAPLPWPTTTGQVAIITVTNECPSDPHTIELYVDADGYQCLCIDSAVPCSGDPTPCKIRFTGPADTFVAFANSRFAGSGLIFSMATSASWYVGSKARHGYEGTATQPLFPSATLTFSGSATATLAAGGGTATIHIEDAVFEAPSTTMAMAGYTDSTCAACAGGGGITGCGGPADVTLTPTTSIWSGTKVREIYGVTLDARSWAYFADGSAYGATGLKNPTWTVS